MKFLKRLICLGIATLAVYSGIMFAVPFYRYYSFKTDAEDIAKFSGSSEEIKQMVMKKARDMSVPVAEKNIVITGENGSYRIKATWSETVNILEQYKRKFDFGFEVPEKK